MRDSLDSLDSLASGRHAQPAALGISQVRLGFVWYKVKCKTRIPSPLAREAWPDPYIPPKKKKEKSLGLHPAFSTLHHFIPGTKPWA